MLRRPRRTSRSRGLGSSAPRRRRSPWRAPAFRSGGRWSCTCGGSCLWGGRTPGPMRGPACRPHRTCHSTRWGSGGTRSGRPATSCRTCGKFPCTCRWSSPPWVLRAPPPARAQLPPPGMPCRIRSSMPWGWTRSSCPKPSCRSAGTTPCTCGCPCAWGAAALCRRHPQASMPTEAMPRRGPKTSSLCAEGAWRPISGGFAFE
mmetsp:Transcript_52154/g.169401  ORF Transcript_52154/g.169401 Transcript_52154/m.169401 type:complete len:203 (+) Transcript_52154:104-712(+)